MKNTLNIRSAVLVAALAAVAATSWAMNESVEAPQPGAALEAPIAVLPNETVVNEPAAPVATQDETPSTVAAPLPAPGAIKPVVAQEPIEAQPPVTVEERRLSTDERIQGDVMDALLRARNLHGKIGVESKDAVVTLSGWTLTAGEAYRAQRTAGAIEGVRYVQNGIRPRIGGSI